MNETKSSYAGVAIGLIALVVALFALNNGSSTGSDRSLARVMSEGRVQVCYAPYPPFISVDSSTGEVSGSYIDVTRAIFGPANVELDFVEDSWGTMVAALQSGRCDVVPGFFAQIPRASSVAFSNTPLHFVGQGVLARIGEYRFSDIADIDKEGVKVVVANGESGHNYVRENFRNADVVVISVESGADLAKIFTEVESGRADVGIADAETVARYAQSHQGSVVNLFPDKPFGLNPVSFGMRYEDVSLRQFIDTALIYLEVNGTISSIERAYDLELLHELKNYGIR